MTRYILSIIYGILTGSLHGLVLWITSDISIRTNSFLVTGDPWAATRLVTGLFDIATFILIISAIGWATWIERKIMEIRQ